MKKIFLSVLLFLIFMPFTSAETRHYKVGGNYYNSFPIDSSCTSCDPFTVRIDGNNYYMVLNNEDKYTYHDILGCLWPKSSLFEPLRLLDTNNDEKLTPSELKAGNVRFVRLKIGRQLGVKNPNLDYDLENISYIDLKWLRIDAVGVPRGSFDIYLNSNRKIIGRVSPLEPYVAERMLEY